MRKRITIISFGLNIVLVGAILFVLRKPAEKFATQPAHQVSSPAVTQKIETVTQTNLIQQAAFAPFDWSQIESEDFLVYAANLRALGCPEETVRDILSAEINDLYVHRRQELLRPFQSRFWDLMAQGDLHDLLPKEAREGVDALDEEKEALLKKVFRATPLEEKNPATTEYETLLADNLSPEKVQRLRDMAEKFNRLRDEIQSGALPQAEKQKKIAALNEQAAVAQKSVLSSEELEEFNLRKSPFAQQLQNLYGFQASEEELRALARLKLDETPKAKQNADGEIKKLLGEKRFSEYERSTNLVFQQIYRIGRRYELSSDAIARTYELTHSIRREAHAVRDNPNFSQVERELAFETIRQSARRGMVANLGERAAETYRRNGDGLDEIGDP